MIGAILSLFGYAKVPPEAALLCTATLEKWVLNPKDPDIFRGLESLEKLLRSTQKGWKP